MKIYVNPQAKKNRQYLEKALAQLPNNLRRALELKQMTQTYLAEETGLRQAHISFLITGRREPTLLTLMIICHAMDIGIDDLLFGRIE